MSSLSLSFSLSSLLFLFAFISSLSGDEYIHWSAAYEGEELSDAFSSIKYIGNGVVLAGKRSSTPLQRVFRSSDYGVEGSWESVGEIQGYTGNHTYFFGYHDNVVVSGTGDQGNPCMIRSNDTGMTWTVVLTSSQIRTLAGGVDPKAVYSPLHMGNSRWICCLRSARAGNHIIESLDDGLTWHHLAVTGLTAGARKMILTSDGNVLYGGTFADIGGATGAFVSRDGGYTWERYLDNQMVFSGLEDLGNGIYLVGTYASGVASVATTVRSRVNGVATVVTSSPHHLSNGSSFALYTMGDSSFDVRPYANATVLNSTAFSYRSDGPDVLPTSDTSGRVNYPTSQKIFRSSDYGYTWTLVATTTVYSSITYIRSISHIGNGVVYAYACASEIYQTGDRGLMYYRSTDWGVTWTQLPTQYVGPYGPLNAVYEVAIVEGKSSVAATQPDSFILHTYLP